MNTTNYDSSWNLQKKYIYVKKLTKLYNEFFPKGFGWVNIKNRKCENTCDVDKHNVGYVINRYPLIVLMFHLSSRAFLYNRRGDTSKMVNCHVHAELFEVNREHTMRTLSWTFNVRWLALEWKYDQWSSFGRVAKYSFRKWLKLGLLCSILFSFTSSIYQILISNTI